MFFCFRGWSGVERARSRRGECAERVVMGCWRRRWRSHRVSAHCLNSALDGDMVALYYLAFGTRVSGGRYDEDQIIFYYCIK